MHIEQPITRNFLEVDSQPEQLPSVQQYPTRDVFLYQVTQIIDNSQASDLVTTLQAIALELHQFLDTQQVVIYSLQNDSPLIPSGSFISSVDISHTYSHCSIAVPIFVRNLNLDAASTGARILWGILIANACDTLASTQQECTILKLVAREISVAIQQAQLITKLNTEINTRHCLETQAEQYIETIDNQNLHIEQLQQQLLAKEKIATLGELIIDLAKEIHNPVSFIFNAVYSASQHAEDLIQLLEYYECHQPTPPVALPNLQTLDINSLKTDFIKQLWSLRASSEQLYQKVYALHNFTDNDGQIKKIDLNHALNGAVTILQHRLKPQQNRPPIEVIKKFSDIPLVQCLPSEINQAFISLLINAIEALEVRMNYDDSFIPKIWISTEIMYSHLSLLSNTYEPHNKQKQKVLIRIYDNGKGILPHIQRHMFEPFFTTKPTGKGIGLGLAISKQIIEKNHRGKLRCNSQLGRGTEFIIEMCTISKHYSDIKKHANF
jgi:two-component system, NtrC family, sensor kinase